MQSALVNRLSCITNTSHNALKMQNTLIRITCIIPNYSLLSSYLQLSSVSLQEYPCVSGTPPSEVGFIADWLPSPEFGSNRRWYVFIRYRVYSRLSVFTRCRNYSRSSVFIRCGSTIDYIGITNICTSSYEISGICPLRSLINLRHMTPH